MKRFEYEDEYQDPMDQTWHKMLKQRGLEGWELISMTPVEWEAPDEGRLVDSMKGVVRIKECCYIFKREIE